MARRSAWGVPPAAPAPPGDRRRRGLWLLRGVLALVIAVFVLQVALNPWIFHIGDRFTPLTAWDGYGTVQASNGGHYLLFTHLQAGFFHAGCSFSGCQMVHGSAQICTERGSTYTLQLQGTVQARWSTDGTRTSLELQGMLSTTASRAGHRTGGQLARRAADGGRHRRQLHERVHPARRHQENPCHHQ